ncbi:MAG TPA: hypothetical protein P5534_03800 [Candidatus Paceibacterota bacterium]|nr:hypothetical protein [Candidatus Paceibacterota bacterium]
MTLTLPLGAITLLFGICLGRAADPLDTWAERCVGTMVRDVAYGAGLFVAVGDAFYSSADGVCWMRQALAAPSVNGLSGVAYGNGRFVVVESGAWRRESRVFISPNGTAWQPSATMPAGELPVIDRVFFGGGTFLAVGQEPNPSTAPGYHWLVMTSPDGLSWTRHSGPTNSGESYYLNAATYGNGVYVAGGWCTNPTTQGLALVSTNLTVWVPVTGFPFSVVNGLGYGKGRFIAVGSSIATSSDGVEWTNHSVGPLGRLAAVTFGGESFAAVGEPQLILSSTDAVHWTQHPTRVDGLHGVTHGNGSFVAIGGYYTDHPRGVAVQSGGRPQVCLQALGLGPSWEPGVRLLLTAEHGHTYRLQSSPQLPTASWIDVSSISLPPGYPDPVRLIDPAASDSHQRFYRVVSP